ncbi:MAG: hypothetical protein ING52_04660 [Burkholderiales bacterium]|jgi:hypothetical protein|nr:hypothetical protein [Burkholderiales bacterium]
MDSSKSSRGSDLNSLPSMSQQHPLANLSTASGVLLGVALGAALWFCALLLYRMLAGA